MEDLDTSHHSDMFLDPQDRTRLGNPRVFSLKGGQFTALRLRALVKITAALEAQLLSMESDVLDGERGLDNNININFYEAVESFEKNLLLTTLTLERGSQTRAARRLSLRVTTLNTMLKRHGIDPRIYKSVIA